MKRSRFDKSFYRLTSSRMGELTPIGVQLVNPGDVIKMSTSAFIRTRPLATPPMHPVHTKIHHWFVPLRLIWSDFEDFITGGEDGLNASVAPYFMSPANTGYAVSSLADHLGVKPGVASRKWSSLYQRAYVMIWNEWYRDTQLQDKKPLSKASGEDTTTYSPSNNPLRVAWEKDFFTTTRPDPQLGPDVYLPLENAPVRGIGKLNATYGQDGNTIRESDGTSRVYTSGSLIDPATADRQFYVEESTEFPGYPNIHADMEGIAPTIRQLRLASAVQWFQENMNAYGGRYTEYLLRNGVKGADSRLQRPEYLGGGKQTIQFSEVLQTAPSYDEEGELQSPVGTMAGHGVTAMRSNAFKYYFQEHGIVISLAVTKPITMYVDGLHRMFSLETKEDYFQKELQHVGMEEVKRKQVDWGASNPEEPWGFQNRYDWLRRNESGVSGLFRTEYADWHFARMLSSLPELEDFIECNPTSRPFADTTDSEKILAVYSHRIQLLSFLSKFGNTKGLSL